MSSDRIVGIDLGTTNSLVAFMQGESPVIIPGEDGSNLVPSVVALDENDRVIVGNGARKYLIETPERAVYSIKRLMGRGLEDTQEELRLFPFRLADDLEPGEVLRIKLATKLSRRLKFLPIFCDSSSAMRSGSLASQSRKQ